MTPAGIPGHRRAYQPLHFHWRNMAPFSKTEYFYFQFAMGKKINDLYL